MNGFVKGRVAIAAVPDTAMLRRCLKQLPPASNALVLSPSQSALNELEQEMEPEPPKQAKRKIWFVVHGLATAGKQRDAKTTVEWGNFADLDALVDRKTATHLRENLKQGCHVLFVGIENAEEETTAFASMSACATGPVRLHDLPRSV